MSAPAWLPVEPAPAPHRAGAWPASPDPGALPWPSLFSFGGPVAPQRAGAGAGAAVGRAPPNPPAVAADCEAEGQAGEESAYLPRAPSATGLPMPDAFGGWGLPVDYRAFGGMGSDAPMANRVASSAFGMPSLFSHFPIDAGGLPAAPVPRRARAPGRHRARREEPPRAWPLFVPPPASSNVVSEVAATLMTLGFNREAAEVAAVATEGKGLQEALDWMVEQERAAPPQPSAAAAVEPPATEEDGSREGARRMAQLEDLVMCRICCDAPKDTVLLPCRHACTCYNCAQRLREHGHSQCPVCRRPISSLLQFYNS